MRTGFLVTGIRLKIIGAKIWNFRTGFSLKGNFPDEIFLFVRLFGL